MLEKPWWKRREYKIPEEHFQVYKRPRKIDVKKYQKKVRYHNSSQFRHWILGAAIMIAYISLGNKSNKNDSSLCSEWCGSQSNDAFMATRLLSGFFSFSPDESMAQKMIKSRALDLWRCLNVLTSLKNYKKDHYSHLQDTSRNKQPSPAKLDGVEDEEWESVDDIPSKFLKNVIEFCSIKLLIYNFYN